MYSGLPSSYKNIFNIKTKYNDPSKQKCSDIWAGGSLGGAVARIFKEVIERDPELMAPVLRGVAADTMLKKLPLMADIANTAVFLVSDLAGKITGVTVDVTCGTTAALNYRVPWQE
ncbi:MAG: family oxidoreductase [Sediminibacterium sp.]|nr:family oxidoreductase [Sediminibacterium sp.]